MEEEQLYEELANEHMGNHGSENKVVILILLLSIIAMVGAVVYMIVQSNTKEDKPQDDEQVVTEKEGYQVEFECDETCTYDLELSNGKVTVTYEKIQNEDYTYLDRVKIGDTVIHAKTSLCGGPATLGVLDDMILISYHDGCDIGGNTLHAYTRDAKEIFSYEYLDSSLNMWLQSTSYQIKGKKILIEATRLYHENTLQLRANKEVDLCKKSDWALHEIDENTIVSGTYEMQYEGNSSFKKPQLIKKETVESVLNTCKEIS